MIVITPRMVLIAFGVAVVVGIALGIIDGLW